MRYLPNPLRLAPLVGLMLSSWACAQAPEAALEWTAPLPCSAEFAKPAPGQPALGLILYRFECPDAPAPRLVSARRSLTSFAFASSADLARGQAPDRDALREIGPVRAAREADLPLAPKDLVGLQARRPIPAGAPLLARDFEPRRLWIGGEPVTVSLRQGAVRATLPGIAQGVGRHGERAGAKIESGKILWGRVELEDGSPLLVVAP